MKTNNNNFLGCFIALALLLASGIVHADIPPDYSVLETITYTYDAEGNRITRSATVSGVPETPIEAQYDQGNRLTQLTLKGQGQNSTDLNCILTYDPAGNLAGKTCSDPGSTTPVTTQYTWDSLNHLTQIHSPGLSASFQYDPLGRRIERTVNGHTTHYLYDGNQAIAELSDTGSTSYLTGLAIDEVIARYPQEGERTLLTDALGSVLIAAKEDASVSTAYGYSAYGETQVMGTDEQNPIQYTSRENDGTGLYYYRARYYDPQLKRFISEDPIGINGGINVYAYVSGNPVNLIDPSGLCQKAVWSGGYIVGWVPCDTPTKPPSPPKPAMECPAGDPQPPAPPPFPIDDKPLESVAPEMFLPIGGAIRGISIVFGHGARHLLGTGLGKGAVEQAIKSDIQLLPGSVSPGAGFWGRVTVGGTTIEYRAMPLPNGGVSVGTYYPIPK